LRINKWRPTAATARRAATAPMSQPADATRPGPTGARFKFENHWSREPTQSQSPASGERAVWWRCPTLLWLGASVGWLVHAAPPRRKCARRGASRGRGKPSALPLSRPRPRALRVRSSDGTGTGGTAGAGELWLREPSPVAAGQGGWDASCTELVRRTWGKGLAKLLATLAVPVPP
jgi:hypothetical protein